MNNLRRRLGARAGAAMLTAACLTGAAMAQSSVSGVDIEAGRSKAQMVCAACHGANGISVAPAIPNLAGQKAAYLTAQILAFKEGRRKNDVMNALAAQLESRDAANLSAFFASLPGATSSSAASEFMPALAAVKMKMPGDFSGYTKYLTIDFPERNQVRHYLANNAALAAAREGRALPDGAAIYVEVYSVKMDDAKKPVKGADGHLAGDKLLFYTAMERQAGWGEPIPDMLRNENWNYAVFTADRSMNPKANQAECLACHKPFDKDSYLFTLKQMTAAARR
jgi:cytochrome c553